MYQYFKYSNSLLLPFDRCRWVASGLYSPRNDPDPEMIPTLKWSPIPPRNDTNPEMIPISLHVDPEMIPN